MAGCAVHCKHCGIRFFTHPRNHNREDLCCPFGCREHHRRELGRERSRRHYQKPEAKRKKELRNSQRSFPVGPDDVTPSPDIHSLPDVDPSPGVNPLPDVDPSRDIDDAAHVAVASEVSSGPCSGATADGNSEMRNEIAIVAATLSTVASAERHETGAEGEGSLPEVVCSELPVAKPCLVDSQHDPVNGERPDTLRGEMPLAGLVLNEACVVHSRILPYVRMVVSLIAGESIAKDQLVEELLQIMRQRSIDNRTSAPYVLRFHDRHPP